MDKILAFSILSSSPAEIAAAGYSTRFSWRTTSGGKQHQQQDEGNKPAGQSSRPAAEGKPEARPRFAPEFDGINCFESIVSF